MFEEFDKNKAICGFLGSQRRLNVVSLPRYVAVSAPRSGRCGESAHARVRFHRFSQPESWTLVQAIRAAIRNDSTARRSETPADENELDCRR